MISSPISTMGISFSIQGKGKGEHRWLICHLAFDFSIKSFESLSYESLYTNTGCKKVDVPVDSVDSVGYIIGIYIGTQVKVKCLSPNLQFVILLDILEVDVLIVNRCWLGALQILPDCGGDTSLGHCSRK